RPDLAGELAVEQEILEHVELAAAILELQRETVQGAQDAAQIELVRIGKQLLGAAERGYGREVELAVIETGHLREPRAERVEAHDIRVHLAEAQRERVDALLQAAPSLVQNRLLSFELAAPALELNRRVRDAVDVGRMPTDVERAGEEREREG